MRNRILLLIGVILLYVLSSLALDAVYGPSYPLWEGEDHWRPDGAGGWAAQGDPFGDPPSEPSLNIPILVPYIPIFLPALLLALFLFTPLKRHLEQKAQPSPEDPPLDGEVGDGNESEA